MVCLITASQPSKIASSASAPDVTQTLESVPSNSSVSVSSAVPMPITAGSGS